MVINQGRVLIKTPDPTQIQLLETILRAQLSQGYVVSRVDLTRRRRYAIGLPGYLAADNLNMSMVVALLMSQNLTMPEDGITPINLFRGTASNPHPLLFVELSEDAITQLTLHYYNIHH